MQDFKKAVASHKATEQEARNNADKCAATMDATKRDVAVALGEGIGLVKGFFATLLGGLSGPLQEQLMAFEPPSNEDEGLLHNIPRRTAVAPALKPAG